MCFALTQSSAFAQDDYLNDLINMWNNHKYEKVYTPLKDYKASKKIVGDFEIEQGIATTRNLQIDGVNAVVKMEGSADIARETQQLKVLILPQLNAGGASVVAGIAINPVIGLTSYLAQWLLTSPLSRAAVQEFTIDGSWREPRVTRTDHNAPAPAPTPAPSKQP